MDEPFGALDPITRIRLQDELLLIQKKLHKTIVIVTHDIDEAIRLADIVAVMQSGKLVQLAPPARLLAEPASPFVEALLGHDRLLKLMRTTPITAVSLDPPTAVGGPRVESRLPVEEALLAMVAAGSDRITVVEEGAIIGSLNASQLLRSVVPAARQRTT
jgi:osmoprotectant transport system ATP-binding protein